MYQRHFASTLLAAALMAGGLPTANVLAAAPRKDGSRVGIPRVGAPGAQETVQDIMERDAATPARTEPRMPPEHEGPDREGLPQGRRSPELSGWPPPSEALSPLAEAPVPSAPQTLGTSFTGATLADTLAFPPDTMGTVGPTQFVVAVNGRIRSFNKAIGVADGVLNADMDVFFEIGR